MDETKKARQYARTAFTRTYNKLLAEWKKSPQNIMELNVAFKLLEEKATNLTTIDQKYFAEMLQEDTTESEINKEMEDADNYRSQFLLAQAEISTLNEKHKQANTVPASIQPQSNIVIQQETKRNYTLPKVQVQRYGGELKEYLHFWSQFKKIHDDPNMSDDDKVYYLDQFILPNSKASELVGSFPRTGVMYGQIIAALKSRFGREELLVEYYVRELLKLVLTNAISTSLKLALSSLYDQLETHIRSLETLGVTTDTCSAMLYPLVESSLPEELLRTWQRQASVANAATTAEGHAVIPTTPKDRLNKLMNFLQAEVHSEQRISMVMSGFGLNDVNSSALVNKTKKNPKKDSQLEVPTAVELLTLEIEKKHECIFCSGTHDSGLCEKAKKLSLEERQEIVKEKHVCFSCLKPRHSSRYCRSKQKCGWCGGKHVLLMCRGIKTNSTSNSTQKPSREPKNETVENNLANLSLNTQVFLQTIHVKLKNKDQEHIIQAVLDSASHRSYILSQTADGIGYEPSGEQKMIHMLFGGTKTKPQVHKGYLVHLKSLDNTYAWNFMALGQDKICHNIPHVNSGPWLRELRQKNIKLTDCQQSDEPISLLIGADVMGKLLTGKIHNLSCGPTAIETRLGWTLMGKNLSEEPSRTDSALVVMSMFTHEAKVSDLWNLDALGIADPTQTRSKEVHQEQVKERFLQTIQINDAGRYEVLLPWKESHPALPDNRMIAQKRLEIVTKKLEAENLRARYHEVLESWQEEGIIEKVPVSEVKQRGYYLPHRHVLKENSTTPIRPVFDASARGKDSPSLNQCLETGPNLIELIPTMLMRFRKKKIGVISDIKKAFLQISVSPRDRDSLRFLWWNKEHPDEVEVYRHCRVVFGVSSSPFLLGATIELHLLQALERASSDKQRESIQKLLRSFYVDNCITSLDTPAEMEQFIIESTSIMTAGKFDLRGWEYSAMSSSNNQTSVLGLTWDKQDDTLMLARSALENQIPEKITKRVILSAAQKVFDPIGLVCPVLLRPKLLIQKLWSEALDWDEEVNEDVKREFIEWHRETSLLKELKIPRWAFGETSTDHAVSLHVFVDASKDAYAAVLFVRTETPEGTKVQLIEAKARVSPTSKTTIPRLELLAATVGARLMDFTSKALKLEYAEKYYWSDSSTVLSWIHDEKQWATFVWNRVQEIRNISDPQKWRHVPGISNPADLPSRGCSAKQLVDSRWWEGPEWLRGTADQWPTNNFKVNESEVNIELKKSVSKGKKSPEVKEVDTTSNQVLLSQQFMKKHDKGISATKSPWYMGEMSKYSVIVRSMAWILRFISNCRRKKVNRTVGEFTTQEITAAESTLFRLVQQDTFDGEEDSRISCLCAYRGRVGLIRLKTLITNRDDNFEFRNPIVLDPQHPLVPKLILFKHEELNHAGNQIVMNSLREKVWILTSRRAIRSVIQKCRTCRRYNSARLKAAPIPLPEPRTRDAAIFEVTGVDYAGPLYLKGGEKAWICLFTCAVYRAVHLELVTSLSTDAFLEAFRRFIARRGRPSIMYSDNGTNFVGTNNLLKKVDWVKIKRYSAFKEIEWRFNPPTAAWWGGWWESLVRSVKELLRKILKRACLTYEEMNTTLCDCESIINARPITYLSEDPSQLVPLTPAMFLQESYQSGVPDIDQIEDKQLQGRFKYRLKLRNDLRRRFRSEYLGQLSRKRDWKGDTVRVGDVVMISMDNKKRVNWPLGLVIEVFPGKDGHVRVARLKTEEGELIRPIQRLCPLEMSRGDDDVILRVDKNRRFSSLTRLSSTKCRKVTQSPLVVSPTGAQYVAKTTVPDLIKDVGEGARPKTKTTRSGRVVKSPRRLSY